MAKSFLSSPDVIEILNRLDRIDPKSPARWGRMNAGQMVCHLNDSFALAMGDRPQPLVSTFVMRQIIKPIALWGPMTWPKNSTTIPGVDQFAGGTPPTTFDADQANLRTMIQRFVEDPPTFQFGIHPLFHEMTRKEWMRWGYLHCDHHFRQFGA